MKTINIYYEDKSKLNEFIQNNYNILFAKESTVFVQVFSGIYEIEFLRKLSLEIVEMIPHAHIIGVTTAGEIMNGAVSGLKTVLSFSIFQHTNVRCALIPKDNQNSYQLGQTMASQLSSEKAKVMIVFATGLTISSNDLLSGIQSVNPSLPIAGGNAGDNSLMQRSLIFDNKAITDCGVVGAVLESDQLYMNQHWHLGWQPIGKEMTITKVEGCRVYTIDDMPAYQAYQTYLGLKDIRNFQNALEYPLVMNRQGILMARSPMISYEDGSLGFAADIHEGEKVRFSYGHVGVILEEVEKLIKKIKRQPVESIFVYSCTSRRGFLQNNCEIETMPLQKIAPSAGFLTYGEYFHANNTNQLLNGTMTVLSLSESATIERNEMPDVSLLESKHNQVSPKKDNIAEKSIGTLRALTHLVNTVTDELVAANEKLKYLSLHDTLTGLYNRAYFDQEMKRYDLYQGSVGIIICDLDCFKLVNDTLGHSFGDEMIRMAAECLASACRPQDTIARIGGDEFVILVPNADKNLLEEIKNRILDIITHKGYVENKQILYMSIGFAIKGQEEAETMMKALKSADLDMYRIKSLESTKVYQTICSALSYIQSRSEQPS